MSNFLQDLGHATQKLFHAVGAEHARALDEAGRHVTESVDAVTRSVEQAGIFGGLATAADRFSPGNIVAGAVDAVIPGRDLPQPLADGISAGANVLLGALVPGAALPLNILGLVDGFQALGGVLGGGRGVGGGQRMQTPENPADAGRRSSSSSSCTAHRVIHAGPDVDAGINVGRLVDIVRRRPEGGFGFDDPRFDGPGFDGRRPGLEDTARAGRRRLARLEHDLHAADAAIDRVLQNPHLCFEDMIFLLLRALVKQSQLEAKIGLQAEKNDRDTARQAERAERQALQRDEAALARDRARIAGMGEGAEKNKALAALSARQTSVNGRREEFTTAVGEATESRQERFEELKQAMQKITEMQQALSNILNTLHQTAMNTIGNIR
jgi:hypothetical protein